MSRLNKGIIIWLFTGCVLIWGMVVVGGITRLTHSGLSMVTWSVFGQLPPHNQQDWQKAFDLYKTSPEYKLINSTFTLNDFKSIYWWEYIHRTIGRSIGMIFIIPFMYLLYLFFFSENKLSRSLMLKLCVILCMGGFQGLLGWYMVKSGLINEPHVSHYRLAAHLITALITFAFTFWVALDLIYPQQPIDKRFVPVKRWNIVLLVFLLIQIMYGAFTSGLHAGQFDPTWPKMGSHWIAPEILSLSPWWSNFLDGIAGVQFVHRYNAYIVTALVFILWFKSRKLELNITQRRGVNFLLGMVFVQFLLGVLTLVNSVPVVLGVLHQTGAFLLLASTVFVLHQWRYAPAKAVV